MTGFTGASLDKQQTRTGRYWRQLRGDCHRPLQPWQAASPGRQVPHGRCVPDAGRSRIRPHSQWGDWAGGRRGGMRTLGL